MEFLFWAVMGLSVVAVVGHGLWVLVRAVVGFVFGGWARGAEYPVRALLCPRCGEMLGQDRAELPCRICGWENGPVGECVPLPDRPVAIGRLRGRILKYRQIGLISEAFAGRLLEGFPSPIDASRPARVDEPVEAIQLDEVVTLADSHPMEPSGEAAPAEPAMAMAGDIATRARVFREARESEPVHVGEPAETKAPARPWTVVLSSFLEEKNIRWGELVGGLLIVGCSMALVISFWSSIARRPWLQFGLFEGVTALVFLAGLHAERRWKLPSTAHGLCVVATMLTPLNFLAVSSMQRGAEGSAWMLAGAAIALIVLGYLVSEVGRELVPSGRWSLVLGVMAPSAVMMGLRWLRGDGSGAAREVGVASLPWLAHAGSVGAFLWKHRRESEWDDGMIHGAFRLLGLSAFASALAFGLFVATGGDPQELARRVSMVMPLAGAPSIAMGLALWKRSYQPDRPAIRVIGPSIAMAGAFVMLAGIVVGWPDPSRMIPVCLLSAAIVTWLAIRQGLAWGHTMAGGCLALAVALGSAIVGGRLAWYPTDPEVVRRALSGGSSCWGVLGLATVYGGLSGWASTRGKRVLADALAMVCGMAGAVAIAALNWRGLGRFEPSLRLPWANSLAALLAVGLPIVRDRREEAGIIEPRRRELVAPWCGAVLLLVGALQGFVFERWGGRLMTGWAGALLAHSAVCLAAAAGLSRWKRGRTAAGVVELAAIASCVAGILVAMSRVPMAAAWSSSGLLAVAALLMFPMAWKQRSGVLFSIHQLAAIGSLTIGVAAFLATSGWVAGSAIHWLDPRMIQGQAVVVGLACLAWSELRMGLGRAGGGSFSGRALALLDSRWPTVDRVARGAVVIAVAMLAVYAAAPGAAQELTPRSMARELVPSIPGASRIVVPIGRFEIPGVPRPDVGGLGIWAALAAAVLAVVGGLRERLTKSGLLGLIVLASSVAPLVASMATPGVAVASMLRWTSVAVLAAISGAIWSRPALSRRVSAFGVRYEPENHAGLVGMVTAAALALAVLPLLAMGLYVGAAAIWERRPESEVVRLWIGSGVGFVAIGGLGSLLSLAGRRSRPWASAAGSLLCLLASLPVVAVTVFAVASSLSGNPITGPEPSSFFGRIGFAGSYVPPIVGLAAVLVGYGVRERQSRYGTAAGLLFGLAAVVAMLMGGAPGRVLDGGLAARLSLLLSTVLSLYAAAWLELATAWKRLDRPVSDDAGDSALFLARAGRWLVALPLAGALATIWFDPTPTTLHEALGGLWGVLAAMSMAVVLFATHRSGREVPLDALGFLLVLVAPTVAAMSTANAGSIAHAAFHASHVGLLLTGAFAVLLAWSFDRKLGDAERRAVVRWVGLTTLIGLAFSVRSLEWADTEPWWAIGGMAAVVAISTALAGWAGRPGFLVLGRIASAMAGASFWLSNPWGWSFAGSGTSPLDLLSVVALTLAIPLPSIASSIWRRRDRGKADTDLTLAEPSFGGVAANWLATALLALLALLSLLGAVEASNRAGGPLVALGWLAVAGVGVSIANAAREPRSRSMASLYILGLVTVGWTVYSAGPPADWLGRTGVVVTAAYALAASFLWSRREAIVRAMETVGLKWKASGRDESRWFVPVSTALAVAVVVAGGAIVLGDPLLGPRHLAANAVIAQALTIGLMAGVAKRRWLEDASLIVGTLGMVAWLGAWIEPQSPTATMDRLAVLASGLLVAASAFGLGCSRERVPETWRGAARRVLPWLIGASGLAVLMLLGWELSATAAGVAAMSWTAVATVTASLIGSVAAAIVAAVVPGRDPLGLAESRRTVYVYGAEALLAALFVHLRMTEPWLFGGYFTRYWPLIILGVSFLGVGLSEWFRRRGQPVLAGPLERTGAFLPALPLLAGLWSAPEPGGDVLFLALAGGLYTVMSLLRSSIGFGAMAALAFNGALWVVLGRSEGLGMLQHPQLWIIPPSLSLLGGSYLVRDRLPAGWLTSIRQGASLAIYVASTADIVLTGVAQAPWLPLVLAGLSIAGIFAGMAMKTRGFVYLGVSFLSLSIFSMVWYAAVDLGMTWIWAASGIVAGIVILAVFAMFERTRQERGTG